MHIKGIKSFLLPAVLLLLISTTTSCSKKKDKDQESDADKVVPVTIIQAKQMTFYPKNSFFGYCRGI